MNNAYNVLLNILPLTISLRTENILKQIKVDDIWQFLNINDDILLKIRNCGYKTCREIYEIQNSVIRYLVKNKVDVNYQNIFLDIFSKNLSILLLKDKIIDINSICFYSDEQLYNINGMTNKYFNELKTFLQNYCKHNISKEIVKKQIIPIKYKNINLLLINFSNRLHNVLEKNNICNIEKLLSYSDNDLIHLSGMGHKSFNELKNFLDNNNIKLGLDYEWEINNKEISIDQFILSLDDLVKNLNEKELYILKARLLHRNKDTLQNISKIYGISRQYTHQIEQNILVKLSRLFKENKHIYDIFFKNYGQIVAFDSLNDTFNKYKWLIINILAKNVDIEYNIDFERELILININISDILDNIFLWEKELSTDDIKNKLYSLISDYVNVKESDNLKSIISNIIPEIISNCFIPIDNNYFIIKQHIKSADSEKSFYIKQTERDKKIFNRYFLFLKFASYFCKSPKNINDIYINYLEYLRNKSPEFIKQYYLDLRYIYDSMLHDKNFLLSLGRQFRYIELSDNDITDIFNKINLSQYNDIEISTKLIYNNNEELMLQYNILNEYELHNFIKKFSKIKYKGRTPNLQFGKVNRKKQIIDILIKFGSISQQKLAEIYENLYGVANETFYSNYLPLIKEYKVNEIYTYKTKLSSEYELHKLKTFFIKDWYSIDEIYKIFNKVYINPVEYVNNINLQRLGYNLNTLYAYSNKFLSSKDLINKIINKNKILDLNQDNLKNIKNVYYPMIKEYRYNFKLIEFYPNKFINLEFIDNSILNMNIINEFISKVEEFIGKCKAAEFVKKKRKDKFYMEQIKSVFFLFIKIIEVIQRYFIFEFENDKDNTNKNYINIRNAVSHSDIFFYGENKQKYLDEFDKNIRDILSFFDEKKDRKSLKIEFLKSMDSLFAKRNNFKLKVVYDKTKDNHKNQIELYDVDVNFNEFLEQNDFSDFNKYSRKNVNNKIKEIINSILSDDNKNNRVQRKNISLVKYSYLLDLKKELRRILKKAKDDNYQQYNSCFQKKIG